MKKREQILLLLMGLALVYGVYSLVFDGRQPPAQTSGQSNAEQILGNIQASLKEPEAGPSLLAALAVDRPWVRDPFEERRRVDQPAGAVQAGPQLAYTGYLDIGALRLAIINGREYGLGERIDGAGLVVRAISPKNVVLRGGGQADLVVPLVENQFDMLNLGTKKK